MSYNILIVDDSAVTRAILKRTIKMLDMPVEQIFEAGNGKLGLEVLNQQAIDLVFTDLNMPEMGGLEMTSILLSREKTRHLPVVVITTESSEQRIEDLTCKGVKKFIRKPFTPETIREVLLELLEPCAM